MSQDVGVARALEARQRAIDHLDGYVGALAKPGCQGAQGIGLFGLGLAQCVDESRIRSLVMRTREAGTWMVPTQSLIEQWAAPPTEEALRARPALRYVPRRWWRSGWSGAKTSRPRTSSLPIALRVSSHSAAR